MTAAGMRVTARCDTCDIDRRFYVVGRDHDADEIPADVIEAFTLGWSRRHIGHEQTVVAVPAYVTDAADVTHPATAIVIVDGR
jgi:hypothetical protein